MDTSSAKSFIVRLMAILMILMKLGLSSFSVVILISSFTNSTSASGFSSTCITRVLLIPVQKKLEIVASTNKIKLNFDMGFNKIEMFFKNFNVFECCPEGAKVTENKDFSSKWLVFCQNVFMIKKYRVLSYTIEKNCPN